ncbi:MAG: hypothetical protein ACYCR8_07230, partial [Cuniculiplasma sp.]
SYSFSLTNGSYTYTLSTSDKIYSPSPSSGSFTVNGASVSNSVKFSFVNYTATFIESSLPSGTAWYVNLSNGMKSGAITGTSYSFSLTNGTYSYNISTAEKIYTPSPASRSFTVNGGSVSNTVPFSAVDYTVTFTESGLPSGTVWYVNLSNGMNSGAITGTSYSFNLTNGSYSYNIATTNKTYHANADSFTVIGKGTPETISFSKFIYTVTFTVSGLPNGTHWSILFNGATSSSNGTSITFRLANGTYSYTISSISGYSTSSSSGSITLNGANIGKNIKFDNTSFSGLTQIQLLGISGAVVTILVILGGVLYLRRK